MNRNFRLTNSSDIERVRRSGKSYAHPLIVLVVLPASGEKPRFGVIAGRSVGNAVQRNHAKRMVREAIRSVQAEIKSGWDIVIICRRPIDHANMNQIQECLCSLINKANLTGTSMNG